MDERTWEEPVVLTRARYAAMVAEIEARTALADIQRMGMQECEREIAALRERITELEGRMSSLAWIPLEDGYYTAEKEYRFGPTTIVITGDLVEVANTNFRLRDDFRLCRRIED